MVMKFVRMKKVAERMDAGLSTVYDWQNPNSPRYIPTFPKRLKIGHAASGVLEQELDAYISQLHRAHEEQE